MYSWRSVCSGSAGPQLGESANEEPADTEDRLYSYYSTDRLSVLHNGLEHLRIWYPQGSWNQSPTDLKGRLYC